MERDPDCRPGDVTNLVEGDVPGIVVQARDIKGGIHVHNPDLNSTLLAANEHLGSGGLAILEGIAQDASGQRQRIVNMLCAHLDEAREDRHESRSAIKQLLLSHLSPERGTAFWPDIDINLAGATLKGFSLRGCHVRKADFSGASFTSAADFSGARFADAASFDGVTFSGSARFDGATFLGDATFTVAQFNGSTTYSAVFDRARFGGAAVFSHAHFDQVGFAGAEFAGDARFGNASFVRGAHFDGARFGGDATFAATSFRFGLFRDARFESDAEFVSARFAEAAEFTGSRFAGAARFESAGFQGGARFDGVEFAGDARFMFAGFDEAVFDSARFAGVAGFGEARFVSGAQFHDTRFSSELGFNRMIDEGTVVPMRPCWVRVSDRARRHWPDGWSVVPADDDDVPMTLPIDYDDSRWGLLVARPDDRPGDHRPSGRR